MYQDKFRMNQNNKIVIYISKNLVSSRYIDIYN